MSRETVLNLAILAGLFAVALTAHLSGEPFLVTLATKAAILGLAGVGLNLALGYGGLVSFGHAAFFGIGGYAAGILASAAQNYEPLMTWPLELPGTTSMPIIWLTAVIAAGLVALPIGALSPAHRRRPLHHDHPRLRADDLLLRHLLARLRRRGRPLDLRPQHPRDPRHHGPAGPSS